ncbi:hypothetical protein [Notoacmeibacter ruber]|uniref:DUF4893 domain-containing protein n=1 Tax=Notoacmeibacter ruber TaxID=2670375 RepID=A0A3L7J9K8_9HYPH|nr:hypothetical protein [Notoacmeibacter ruber]RLQ87159.1 hypothetical protein D8780_01950 [Notoacmeibacter ruber]
MTIAATDPQRCRQRATSRKTRYPARLLALFILLLSISPSVAQQIAPGSIDELAETDREVINDTPFAVRRTLAELVTQGFQPGNLERALMGRLAGNEQPSFSNFLVLGQRRCTVWWYGAGSTAKQRVASDRCAIEYGKSGETIIRNVTGDRFNIRLIPMEDGGVAYAGRSFLPSHFEQAYDADNPVNMFDEGYGNIAGRAVISDRSLLLVTGAERSHAEEDETFFQLVEVPDR